MTPLLGTILMFAGNFAPTGWALCEGQLLAISQNTALFSIIGTVYGGNGTTTFALPDLRGRVPIGQGGSYSVGQVGGSASVTLSEGQLPAHTHAVNAYGLPGDVMGPQNALPAAGDPTLHKGPYTDQPPDSTMSPQMIGMTGQGQPVSVLQPFLAVTYIIAIYGIFPSRN